MLFAMVQGGLHGLFGGGRHLKAGPSQGKLSLAAENCSFPRAFPGIGVTGLRAAFSQGCLLPGHLAAPGAVLHCRKAPIPLQSWVIQTVNPLSVLDSVRDELPGHVSHKWQRLFPQFL